MTTMVKKDLLNERKGWAGEIAALTAAHEKALPGLNAAVDSAAAGVEEAKEALKEAATAHRTATIHRTSAARRLDTERNPLAARLRYRRTIVYCEF